MSMAETTNGDENETTEELSALHDNIARKGNNSYYYAHGSKIDGPAWDGREEPRLLATSEKIPASSSHKGRTYTFDSYSWADEKKTVKIYIDFDKADEISDDDIKLVHEDDRLEFSVTKEEKLYKLVLDPLDGAVESVSYKKKSDKFVLSLKKDGELTWYQLMKKT
jgi:hypothetical protein